MTEIIVIGNNYYDYEIIWDYDGNNSCTNNYYDHEIIVIIHI